MSRKKGKEEERRGRNGMEKEWKKIRKKRLRNGEKAKTGESKKKRMK